MRNEISFLIAVIEQQPSDDVLVYLLVIITSVLAISLVFLFMMLCKFYPVMQQAPGTNFRVPILDNRFQRRRQAAMRSKMLHEQDLQLSRLRATADDSTLTNFNPSYGCEGILNGGSVDVKSLPQVARESLRLVK